MHRNLIPRKHHQGQLEVPTMVSNCQNLFWQSYPKLKTHMVLWNAENYLPNNTAHPQRPDLQDKHTICLLISYQLDFEETDTFSPFSRFSFFILQRYHTLFLCHFSLPSVYFCSRCPQSKGRALSVKLLKLYGIYLGSYQNLYPPQCR
jgi:hypothetical protein